VAVIERLPAQSVIDGFRGVLDFYVYKGLNVVRSWPRGKGLGLAPGTIATQPLFTRSARLKKHYSQICSVAARRYGMAGTSTWQDVLTSAYFGKVDPSGAPLPGSPDS